MADVVTTKLFRNGGSLAVRIPAGWVAEGEITLSRNPVSGDIVISQRSARMRTLLQQLAAANAVEDSVFEAATAREMIDEDLSIFEKQENQVVSD